MSVIDKDLGMISVRKTLKDLRKIDLKVGILKDALNTEEGDVKYVADYATINEYGRPGHTPERSFMRSTANERGDDWLRIASESVGYALEGGSIERELYKVGAIVRADIIAKIDSNIPPANSPATIKRKGIGKNKTLIDHGILRNSVDVRIETRGERK